MKINIGVVGATGAVGEAFLKLLQERNFPVGNLKLFASENSKGLNILFNGVNYPCEVLSENCFEGLDLVFFSSGDDISKTWAPRAVQQGAFAVDNSAAFRMSPEHKLIVPEINGHLLNSNGPKEVIANPNCSTIQLVVALAPLHQQFELADVKVATYQSVSGAGKEGREELLSQTQEFLSGTQSSSKPKVFAHTIAFNCIPQIGSFNDSGFSSEEMKIMYETRKILNLPDLPVSAFTVRVPSLNCHSEAVWVKLKKTFQENEVQSCLENFDGLHYIPHNQDSNYPTQISADQKHPVFVGRVHRDHFDPQTLLMWVVADNLYKGAALNGLQIAEKLYKINS